MALQSSGTIWMSNIRDEFGNWEPPNWINHYYRGAGLVPTTRTVWAEARDPTSGDLFGGGYSWGHYNDMSGYVMWAGTKYSLGPVPISQGYLDIAGVGRVYRGTVQSGDYFRVYRTYGYQTTQEINTGVPSSGTIWFSQFYGTTKT